MELFIKNCCLLCSILCAGFLFGILSLLEQLPITNQDIVHLIKNRCSIARCTSLDKTHVKNFNSKYGVHMHMDAINADNKFCKVSLKSIMAK